jgi:hypothetical protein
MMATESTVQKRVWAAMGGTSVLFRLNSGAGIVSNGGKPQWCSNGSVIVPNGRSIPLGFGDVSGKPVSGPPDLVGWTRILITSEMVGHTLAVFTGIEAKETSGGSKRVAQVQFGDQLSRSGGITGFANSAPAALKIIADFYGRFRQKSL